MSAPARTNPPGRSIGRAEDTAGASEEARRALIEELEDAVGKDAVEEADVDIDRAIAERRDPVRAALASSNLLIVITGATALTVGAIAALSVGSWWLVFVALFLHGMLTAVVVGVSMALASQVEKPDPRAVRKLEAAGVDDPELVINNLVEQVAGEQERSRIRRTLADDAGETLRSEEDPAEATRRQQIAMTPASEPTRKAGAD